jgi:hypothetical protein
VNAGLIENFDNSFVPSICFSDLEIIFTLLENEVERIHYLIRRSQIEKQLQYIGDEGDLLAFYLDTGFNLGDMEAQGYALNLLLKSKELDPYFSARANGITIKKPRLKLTEWWRDIIDYIVLRKPQLWAEIGYILLNVPYEDQQKFKKNLINLSVKVQRGKTDLPHNWVVLETVPQDRSYFIAAFPYSMVEREERNKIIRHIISEGGRNQSSLGSICLGVSVTTPQYPYNVLVYTPKKLISLKAHNDTTDN